MTDLASSLFEEQRRLSRHEPPPHLKTRLNRLSRIRDLAIDNADLIAKAIAADFGVRSRTETMLLEIAPLLSSIRHTRRNLPRWMKPQARHVDLTFQPGKAYVRHEPLGVVGIISPWNYPLLLSLGPLVDAIAAGNRALLKPSELTPQFSELLEKLVSQRFDAGEVAVVTGGVETAEAFCRLPFDHLFFTGSTSIGRKVMQVAAANLTPVTLELGGKSPAVICDDYPAEKAARSIAFGKFVNAGQTCIAPDYILAPAAKARAIADAVIDQARRGYPTITNNDDYSAVISQRHYDRLARAIAMARDAGATVLTHEDDGARQARKIGPTVVLGAPAESLLLNEEIFGPVLPIVPYDNLDSALGFIKARERPLALYCFSNSRDVRRKILDRAISGGVTLNGTLLHIAQDSLPFGGVGHSGIGAYHGFEGFRRLSHARGVFEVGFVNMFERIGPPWGQRAAQIGKFLLRR
ncbi:MAG: aldehyde dehydrogenase family protein [Alphaproteobacteria bacterium]|nr:aldehyde dehydrogenase family protein [Alphaproteobacteria bacterium]